VTDRLRGQVALVTGGGTGIGAATARRFAAEGAQVAVFGLEPEALTDVASEIGGIAVPGDAASAADAETAVAAAVERFGGLDAVVTCAGSAELGSLLDMDPAAFAVSMRNNLDSAIVSARAALPALIEGGGGSITMISSVGGLSAGPQIASYSTAKAGLLGLVRSLAVDFGPQGIRANAICPGWVGTRMTKGVIGDFAAGRGISEEEAERRVHAVVPLRRPAAPEEIAAVCLFLASPDASFVTGSVIVADGGQMAVNVGTIPLVLN
jgi:NAD(P)-dependent dehydrogenase (short-subunit alcohol dehydrogenase family)